MSVETGVAQAHPDWDTTQVAEEVQRIYKELELQMLQNARVMLGGGPGEDLMGELEEIPNALSGTDDNTEVEQNAASSSGGGDVPTIT